MSQEVYSEKLRPLLMLVEVFAEHKLLEGERKKYFPQLTDSRFYILGGNTASVRSLSRQVDLMRTSSNEEFTTEFFKKYRRP